ncbi:preprotein translocase subunit YajC [Acinetobacter chinensis]|uniref:Preprotein translocase subunit YajC n=1 Tax=Acinetobacter chinensis TaxID=2004650 RepID=A0ABU3WI55_9GAMM|nr:MULTISPECIES: preprotein translocase subunit YajC [Acinetobacter]AXY59383.1 preprotein translocase subunit YajC [Acinetobacter sp. WCHAc010052]MDV2470017.1 preprotein translocase subunit YajC [Acinetobacter chinensis]
MFHLSHNYELGIIALVLAFLIFYVPAVYAFFAIRKQHKRNQNK